METKWARLYIDKHQDSQKALALLRNSKYPVITFPVRGSFGPNLKLGRTVYEGLKAIEKLTQQS